MAHGNVYFARLAIPVNRQPQRLLQLASHLGREHDVGHAVGIVKYLDTFPRKIVKRVRIGNVAIAFRPMRNRLAPRLEEGLLARPAGRKMHRLAISLDLHPLSGLPSLAPGEQVSHARPRFAQLLGERRNIHDVMPQTQHFPAFRKFSERNEPCRLPQNRRATLRFHARIPSLLKRFILCHPHCESLVSSLHKRKYGTKRESCRRKVGRFKNMKIPHLSRNTEIATDTGFDDRSSERQKFQALRRGDQASK